MKKSICALTCLVCLGAFTGVNAGSQAVGQGAHPITKVIKMLEGLKMKSIMEGKTEAEAYNKFSYWCSTSIDALQSAIADEKEKIAELSDLLSGKKKEKYSLEEDIKALEEQQADMAASAKKAKDQRKEESDLYKKVLGDLKMTIQAVADAQRAMTSSQKATEPGMLLAQRHVKSVLALLSVYSSTTEAQLSTLRSFAGGRPDQLAKGDLNKHVDQYEFKSGNVIELLKELKAKFQDEKLAATKEETNAVNSYELAKKALDNAKKAAGLSETRKSTTLAKVVKTITETEKALKSENNDKKADSKSLSDTQEACQIKKGEWEERSTVRANEIDAMEIAQKILAKATGVRTEAPGNPVPPPSPVGFLQIDMPAANPKMAAVLILRAAAQTLHSKALERLTVEVTAHLSGPFDQVNNMIQKMIFKLMDEQRQEDEHKDWCDQELEKTNVMKDDKEDKIKDLKAEIKTENAKVGELVEEIKSAEEMIADIIAFKSEATEVRKVGKHENKLALADAEAGQKALANAIAVLTDFYKESGEIKKDAWELIQKPMKLPENPKTWDAPFTGVADPDKQPSGIITILENVMSDFAKMETETKNQEAVDQKEYDQAMSDNDIEMAGRTQESSMKSNEKKSRVAKIASLEGQKKNTVGELEKTDQYLSDLKPACVNTDKGASYEGRKAARTKEIGALKTAQVTLENAFKEKKAANFLQIHSHQQIA